jgi:hypothetical protein
MLLKLHRAGSIVIINIFIEVLAEFKTKTEPSDLGA